MPQGLQCFNADGKIIVDLTDSQLTAFASITVGDAIAPQSVSDYFGSENIGRELTLNGIAPDTTVAFVTGIQAGTERNVVGMQRCLISIVSPNTYVLSCFETRPAATALIIFYKFR